jgi:RNA polymerase sigma-70 factor (ECF subfamily)
MASDRVTRQSDADLDLIDRASRGDPDAFDVLIADRVGSAFRLAKAIVGDTHEAEDVVEEAFVSAWRNLPRLREAQRFDAWFDRILLNAARRTRQRGSAASVALETGDGGSANDPVQGAIGRLPVDQRAVLAMYHLEGLSVEEVAAVLGTSVGTAGSRLRDARNALERASVAQR